VGDTIDAVPVCYAVVSNRIVTPVDRIKPKVTTDLARLKNLERNGTATLLCEEWVAHDWSRLSWVRAYLVRRTIDEVDGARLVAYESALREKYTQYRDGDFAELVLFDVVSMLGWAASATQRGGSEALI
jgi:hypothetical protein